MAKSQEVPGNNDLVLRSGSSLVVEPTGLAWNDKGYQGTAPFPFFPSIGNWLSQGFLTCVGNNPLD
ncbi:hypothetical protein [Candidatus Methylacidithermus pantelleriae]|uniref:hypothetical protein n=1 Tax=Candidatus Methylacidithermus pantelleriae TaxID=2744239 RepID=UPI00157C92B8|nr:hypothetical protein [Candidatus Methylacidithermus pantelleriae]